LDFINPCKYLDFIPPLAILFNFLKSKIDLEFTIFLFNFHFKPGEVSIEKGVPLFKTFKFIFYLRIFELEKTFFEPFQF
jgi:hypothetical protein